MTILNNVFVQNFQMPSVHFSLRGASLKTVLILSIFSILALLLFSLYQVNEMTKTFYLVQGYEKKIYLISQEQEGLENNLSQSKSMGDIEAAIKSLGFEPVGAMRYVKSSEGGVAVRQ